MEHPRLPQLHVHCSWRPLTQPRSALWSGKPSAYSFVDYNQSSRPQKAPCCLSHRPLWPIGIEIGLEWLEITCQLASPSTSECCKCLEYLINVSLTFVRRHDPCRWQGWQRSFWVFTLLHPTLNLIRVSANNMGVQEHVCIPWMTRIRFRRLREGWRQSSNASTSSLAVKE